MVGALRDLKERAEIAYEMYPRNGNKWEEAMILDAAITRAAALTKENTDAG